MRVKWWEERDDSNDWYGRLLMAEDGSGYGTSKIHQRAIVESGNCERSFRNLDIMERGGERSRCMGREGKEMGAEINKMKRPNTDVF